MSRSKQTIADNTLVQVKEEFKEGFEYPVLVGKLCYVTNNSWGLNMGHVAIHNDKGNTRYRVDLTQFEKVLCQGSTVKTYGTHLYVRKFGKEFSGSTLVALEKEINSFAKNVDNNELKIGQKMIVTDFERGYSSEDLSRTKKIAVVTIKSVGKKTYKLSDGSLIEKFDWHGNLIDYTQKHSFYHRYTYDRGRNDCEVTGKGFAPHFVRKYSEELYKELRGYVVENYKKDTEQDRIWEERNAIIKLWENAFNPLQLELFKKGQGMFVDMVCSKCQNYDSEKDICKVKRHWDYGILKETGYQITNCGDFLLKEGATIE